MPVVIKDYADEKTRRNATIEESEVYKAIEHCETDDYTELLRNDNRFFMFQHLSDYRSAMLRWYPFEPNASVLEIGAGMGAMTGALCDRVQKVTVTEDSFFCAKALERRFGNRENLTIYAADVLNIPFVEKFDYVVSFGQLEQVVSYGNQTKTYTDYLDKLLGLVKPNGVLLLHVENQYGIHNLCGKKDSHSGIAFDALASYPNRSKGKGFHKAELTRIVQAAKPNDYKFYYPVPDYLAPRMILTDESDLTANTLRERLPYNTLSDTSAICPENDFYANAVENKSFDFVANSFFVEITKRQRKCSDVSYVTLSTTRERKKSFATIIHKNENKVEKRPLFNEGLTYAEYLCDNVRYLQKRGISVLPMQFQNGALWMDYIHAPTVLQYIGQLVENNEPVEKFFTVFDKLWEKILNSSDLIEECSADIDDTIPDGSGPILKYAYLELITLNSFWIDNNIVYFDQEFVREQYPAKYILMRNILLVYSIVGKTEEYLSKKDLCGRYSISDELFAYFLTMEYRFNSEENPGVIEKRFVPLVDKMSENRMILTEGTLFTKNTPLIKKVADIQYNMLYRMIQVCEQYNLKFFLIYGSLLGAVRHQGRIPGDDDIDIALPRDDYDKFLSIADKAFESPYFLQTPLNDNCFYGGFSKLIHIETSAIVEQNWWTDCKEGIGIDIFPLDYGYENKRKEKAKYRKIAFYQRLLYAKAYGYFASFNDMPLLIWKMYKYYGKLFAKSYLVEKMDKYLKAGDKTDKAPYGIYTHYTEGKPKKQFRASDFSFAITMRYEQLELPVPSGYKNVLRTRYGKGYSYFQQKELGSKLHAFYAPSVPFENYKKRFQGGARIKVGSKKIVLFGDPFIVRQYMELKGMQFMPSFVVWDTNAPWNITQEERFAEIKKHAEKTKNSLGETYSSLQAMDWEQYEADEHEKLTNNIYPIICTVNIRETERRLRRLGIKNDYYIFVKDRSMISYVDPLEYILVNNEATGGR